jgi:uncharacterized cupredoxin-like copper-binding protein
MKIATLAALLVAGFLVAVGCGEDRGESGTSTSTGGTGTTATTATTPTEPEESGKAIEVALNEWKVVVGAPSVGAGATKFEAENAGKVEHELVVLETDTKAADLTVEGATAKEEGTNLGEASGIAPGERGEVSVELASGTHYVLLCNLPGHYQQGMYTDLDVQ